MNDIALPELNKTASVKEATLFIDKSIRKTAEQILETGYGFYVLSEACKTEDISFSNTIAERYKLTKTAGSKWVKIGSKYKDLFQYRNLLPTSYSTIYSLLTLPQKAFNEVIDDGCLHPSMTFEEAEQIKSAYKADAKAKKEAKENPKQEENPFDEENIEKSEEILNTEAEKELNPTSSANKTDQKDPIEGEFIEVDKPSKSSKKKKMTVLEALEILEIDLDDAFMIAKRSKVHTDEELLEAIAVIRGE